MAIQAVTHDYGVDVSKGTLQMAAEQGPESIPNELKSIRHWLKSVPAGSCFAVEATGTYHVLFVKQAHRMGHTVYLIDGFRLNRYRDSIGGRAKNDVLDAVLLRRYLQREKADLRPWEPAPKGYTELMRLLHRRERLVTARVALEQSLGDLPESRSSVQALLRQLRRLADRLERRIVATVLTRGWGEDMRRCQQIEGIGPLTSAALATVFQRGHFRNADAFIAFLGLDVRVRDSGKQRGKRKLTKKGDSELRRLLYNAAMSASSTPRWHPYYERHLARGLTKIQALVALGRKLARVAFALMQNQSDYQPKIPQEACIGA
jgi:transposase